MPDSVVTVVGTLTRDPELRFTQGAQGVATIGIAVNRRYQRNNEWVEDTSFLNVTAWGSLAENAAATLNKGSRVIVTGRLNQRSYETQNGEKRSVVEIVADDIGPSLRWATAVIEKTQRSDNQGGGNQGGNSGSYGHSGTQNNRSADPVYGDEEPF